MLAVLPMSDDKVPLDDILVVFALTKHRIYYLRINKIENGPQDIAPMLW